MRRKPIRRRVVKGSERAPVIGARQVGRVTPSELVDVTVRLRRQRPDAFERAIRSRRTSRTTAPLSREELATLGAAPADVDKLERFAQEHGLTVVEVSLARRSVVLRGPADAMQAAFGVTLERFALADRSFRQRTGPVHVPAEIQDIVEGVFGLDDRPQAQPHFRRHDTSSDAPFRPRARKEGFSPVDVARAYDFPSDATGRDQCIALIELGGGYRVQDLQNYFTGLRLPLPSVVSVGVDAAHNLPTGSPDGPDGEVVLDVQVAGAVASGARIAVYFAPNSDRGFLDAITTAIHDTLRKPTVISISWGGPEQSWTSQARAAFDDAFQEAVALGIPVFAASGDNGSSDGVGDGQDHVDFPASSPHVIGCGGTQLEVASDGTVSAEQVWNDLGQGGGATGGGFSRFFQAPAWQQAALSGSPQRRMRGVPDVSGDAAPGTGYRVLIDGSEQVIGGTSAVAPLYAALASLCAEVAGPPPTGLLAALYGARSSFRDIRQGSNGGFTAAEGWDPCTGLGVARGAEVLRTVWRKPKARSGSKARKPARKRVTRKKAQRKKVGRKKAGSKKVGPKKTRRARPRRRTRAR